MSRIQEVQSGQILVEELLRSDPLEELSAILDGMIAGDDMREVPPMWHSVCMLPQWRTSDLGSDGHPRAGIPSPPGEGYRRMFAGGATTHLAPLVVGSVARRMTMVLSQTEKQGRSGPLRFVTVRHEISQHGRTCIIEDQDIVYRPMDPEGSAPTSARELEKSDEPAYDATVSFDVDPVSLFRFSATTRNAHRIHYDLPYAQYEGFADLVIHGPLQVLLMSSALMKSGATFTGKTFKFRLTAPAVGAQRLRVLAGSAGQQWAEVRDGNGVVTAKSVIEEGNAG